MGVTAHGLAAIVKTRGNKDVHVILRGGTKGPNYSQEYVTKYIEDIEKKQRNYGTEHPFASIMIDCSREFPYFLPRFSTFPHMGCVCVCFNTDGNSQKNHNNQPLVLRSICEQLSSGERHITGVMIESHINEGRQDVPEAGPSALKYGVSITDACVEWARTVEMLDALDAAVKKRREVLIERGFLKKGLAIVNHTQDAVIVNGAKEQEVAA